MSLSVLSKLKRWSILARHFCWLSISICICHICHSDCKTCYGCNELNVIMIRSQPFDCKASVRYLRKVFPPLCCCGVQIYKMRCRFWSVYIYCMYLFPPPSFLHLSLSLSASLIFSPLPLSLSLCQPPPTWTPRANERSTSNRHGNSMWMCSARGVGRSACRNCTRRLSWIYRVYCKVGESAAGCLPVCLVPREIASLVCRIPRHDRLSGSCVFVFCACGCAFTLSANIHHFHSLSVFPSACMRGCICLSVPLSILLFSLSCLSRFSLSLNHTFLYDPFDSDCWTVLLSAVISFLTEWLHRS